MTANSVAAMWRVVVLVIMGVTRVHSLAIGAPVRVNIMGITLHEGAETSVTNCILSDDTTGAKIWDAGRVLASLLAAAGSDLRGKRVLELGSGTGIGGLTAAACGASVTLTDGSSDMLSLLEENIQVNGLGEATCCQQLCWGDMVMAAELVAHGPWDLIIGSDLLYAPESLPELVATLAALSTPGRTEILLAYPTRHTEQLFFELADDSFEADGWPVEVEPGLWAARLTMRV